MTDPSELATTLRAIAAALEALGVPWAIGGSLASSAWGEPRATNDVDLIAALDVPAARAFTGALGPTFYADADSAAEAVRRSSSFNVIDQRAFIKVDVFVPPAVVLGVAALGRGQLDRRQPLALFPSLPPMPVLAAEDVVLQKLRWFQIGGEVSERQWRDILSVLKLAHGLDEPYLEEVATAAGLLPLLEKARRELR